MTSRRSGEVGWVTSAGLVYRLVLSQLVTVGRVVALTAVGGLLALVAWAVERSATNSQWKSVLERQEDAAELIASLGLGSVVPIITLAFAGGTLGDLRNDETLVYFWLRPMSRWPIVVGAVAAGVTMSVPFAAMSVSVAAALLNVGGTMVTAAMLASLVGVVAYGALFVLLGLVVRNPIVWGLAYVIIWEGVASSFGSLPARLSVRGYTTSILGERTNQILECATRSEVTAFVVLALITVGSVMVASWRLGRLDVP